MDFFASILRFLDTAMETPTCYGLFHILWLVGFALATVALCLWHRKHPLDQRKVILSVSVAVIILELYKQLNFSFSYENGVVFDYQWYAFPFQFCSTPMYVGLLAGIIKKGKVHDALCAYLSTFAIFAGAAVMVYPGDVFIQTIGINIQTMVCHGSMILVGVYLLATNYVKSEHKTILKAACVFVVCLGIAMVLNEIAHRTGLLETDTFNMFYISPYCDPHLPVFSLVQPLLPYPLELVVYILGFTAAAYIMLLLSMAAKSMAKKKAKQTV